jgi:hypothetical protein
MTNDIEILLEGLDDGNISSILKKYNEIHTMKSKLEDVEEMLKTKVKIFLKERFWNKYLDETSKISLTLTTESREVIDRKILKSMLSTEQLSHIIKVEQHEKLLILTPEARERMRSFVKK